MRSWSYALPMALGPSNTQANHSSRTEEETRICTNSCTNLHEFGLVEIRAVIRVDSCLVFNGSPL